jgi:site-specific recombinase XerD
LPISFSHSGLFASAKKDVAVWMNGSQYQQHRKGTKRMSNKNEFRVYLETLEREFARYLAQHLSERTVRKHCHVIGLFIAFICFDCGVKDIQDITRGMANSYFRKWYMSKVGDVTEREVSVAVRKFFQFLDTEKGIRNDAVLKSFAKSGKRRP